MRFLAICFVALLAAAGGVGLAYYSNQPTNQPAASDNPFEKRTQPELVVTLAVDEPIPSSLYALTDSLMPIVFDGFDNGDETRLRFREDRDKTVVEGLVGDNLVAPFLTNPDVRLTDVDTINQTIELTYVPDY